MDTKGTVVVIGAGASGRSCARRLAASGWRTILCEKGRWGGTCLWYGCLPKKSLYHSATTYRQVLNAEQFGIRCERAMVDWQGVLAWKWHAQETFAGDQEGSLREAGIEVRSAEARFVSAEVVDVGGEHVRFDHAVIATGSHPHLPPLQGIELADTSDEALRYPAMPESLVVVGGGFVAMEMAGIFASFGSRVTMLVRGDRVLDMLDEDLAAVAQASLSELGVQFIFGANARSIVSAGEALSVEYEQMGESYSASGQRVLVAVGRVPALSSLDLPAADVVLDDRGHLVLDEFGRTTNPRIWAVGDAAGGMMQTPIASYEGRIVAQSIDTGTPGHADCSAVPVTCFTVPQLASAGLTEAQAQARGRRVEVRRVPASDIGAAIVADAREMMVKLVFDADSRIVLGAQAAGPSASDVIYAAAVAIKAAVTVEELGEMLGVHPSFAEAVYFAGG